MNDATVVTQSSATVSFYIKKVSPVRFTAATVFVEIRINFPLLAFMGSYVCWRDANELTLYFKIYY